MSPRIPLLCLAVVLAVSTPLAAQKDAAPVDPVTVLRQLEKLEKQHEQSVLSSRQSALSQIKAAASSGSAAVAFFEQAMEAVQFEGMRNKGGSFAEWKKDRSDILRSKEFQAILVLHLRYLALSLERKQSDKPELFVQPSLTFAADMAAGPDPRGGGNELQTLLRSLLGQPLGEGIFARWLRIGSSLPNGESWELTAGNVRGILEKNVRPILRETKDPRLLATWEFEMQILANAASQGRRDHQAAEFNIVARPRIQFSRVNDMLVLDMKNSAIKELLSMLESYPQHPDFGIWARKLRDLLPAPAAAPTATPPLEPAPVIPGQDGTP